METAPIPGGVKPLPVLSNSPANSPAQASAPVPGLEIPPALKPPVDPATLVHKDLKRGRFWSHIPAYAEVDEATFLDHKWQSKHTITYVDKL